MSKIDRAARGPSWTEVIVGAVLSVILGVVIAAALLILRPVISATALPKQPVPGAVYYIKGGAGSSGDALAKRDALIRGQPVKLTEGDINSLIAADAPHPAPEKPGKKGAAESKSQWLETGTPNVRIRQGVMQVAVPVKVNVYGYAAEIIAQARGGFVEKAGKIAFEPRELYFGSCPVQRLPFVPSFIERRVLGAHPVPKDLAEAWSKVSSASVEGSTLNLSM